MLQTVPVSEPTAVQIDSSLFSVSMGAWNFLLLRWGEKVAASPPLCSLACGSPC
jgi:hypothetical protein